MTTHINMTWRSCLNPVLISLAVIVLPMVVAWSLNYISTTVNESTIRMRVVELFENKPRLGLTSGFDSTFEACQMFSIIASAPSYKEDMSLVGRVFIHSMYEDARDSHNRRDYCSGLHNIVSQHYGKIDVHPDWNSVTTIDPDRLVRNYYFKNRYWLTQKPIYTILLTKLNLATSRVLILSVIILSCIGLIVATFWSRQSEVIAAIAPLGLFAVTLSALPIWTGVALAPPFAMCTIGILGLAVLSVTNKQRWAPYWCLGFGVVGQLVWLWDYTHALALAAIALVAYFWWNRDGTAGYARWLRSAFWCSGYVSGWTITFVTGMLIRQWARLYDDERWRSTLKSIFQRKYDRYWYEQQKESWYQWFISDVERWIEQIMNPGTILPLLALLGFGIIAVWAVLRTQSDGSLRSVWRIASDGIFLVLLALLTMLQLAVYGDIEHSSARFVFVPVALAASLVLLMVMHIMPLMKSKRTT